MRPTAFPVPRELFGIGFILGPGTYICWTYSRRESTHNRHRPELVGADLRIHISSNRNGFNTHNGNWDIPPPCTRQHRVSAD